MQKDLLDRKPVSNPSHVRMLCYIIKLMEKKGAGYQVLFVGPDTDGTDEAGLSAAWEKLSAVIKRNTDINDVNIQYTKERNIVALYGKDDNEAKRFSDGIRKECPTAACEFLNG